jgi:hypothetical protein
MITWVDFTNPVALKWQYEYLQIPGTREQVQKVLAEKYPTLGGEVFYHTPTATAFVPANFVGGTHETT